MLVVGPNAKHPCARCDTGYKISVCYDCCPYLIHGEYNLNDVFPVLEECMFCDDRIDEVSAYLLHNQSKVMGGHIDYELEYYELEEFMS